MSGDEGVHLRLGDRYFDRGCRPTRLKVGPEAIQAVLSDRSGLRYEDDRELNSFLFDLVQSYLRHYEKQIWGFFR